MRSLLAILFRENGCDVIEVGDGEEALRILSTSAEPTVIFSDVCMPRVGGLELLRELERRGCRIPVVLITNLPDTAVRREALTLGALAVYSKPVDLDALLEHIHAVQVHP